MAQFRTEVILGGKTATGPEFPPRSWRNSGRASVRQ
jgi:hypothetical protein